MPITLAEAYDLFNRVKDVLVVEDDADVRETLSELLSAAGYDVRAVGDGFAALAEVASRRPHVVLLDLSLPGMNGWSFLAELRRRLHESTPPVVLVSSRPDLPEQARRLGLEHYLSKPFHLNDFYRVIDACG